jgi:hypothetical protein
MTFGPEIYVPVLKIKPGEKEALRSLAPAVRPRVRPFLEIVERRAKKGKSPPPLAQHLDNQFNELGPTVGLFEKFFLDCREIESDGPAAVAEILARAGQLATPVTPVTGISRTFDTDAVMSNRQNGIAIRLTRAEFEAGRIPRGLPAFMKKHSLAYEETDLLVDLGAVDTMITPGVLTLADAFLGDVPDRQRWRTLTISGCAFPQSMSVVGSQSYGQIDRAEWLAWRDGLHQRRGHLDRLPTFSDCAIQHPKGVEGFDPETMSVSASIRITQTDKWLLVKGVSTKKVRPRVQFAQLATRLVYGDLKAYFAQPEHCAGCALMLAAANGRPKLGAAVVWRRLGTIHHITRAVELISALSWP